MATVEETVDREHHKTAIKTVTITGEVRQTLMRSAMISWGDLMDVLAEASKTISHRGGQGVAITRMIAVAQAKMEDSFDAQLPLPCVSQGGQLSSVEEVISLATKEEAQVETETTPEAKPSVSLKDKQPEVQSSLKAAQDRARKGQHKKGGSL